MKHISEIINEDKLIYELSGDYVDKTKKILDDLIDSLPEMPNVKHESRGVFIQGKFGFNKDDLLRSAPAESSEYIGHPQIIRLPIDTEHEKGFNVEIAKKAFNQIFGLKINEGIFDDNITKELPEYEWVQKLYDSLSKYFNTKSFDKVYSEYYVSYNKYPAGIYKTLKNLPTTEKDDLFMTLYAIDLRRFEPNIKYGEITIAMFVYEKKDPNKVKEINVANAARKPLDIVGRELMVGDLVAYASIGGYGGYKGMLTGTVVKASKDQVTFENGKSAYANRCCLISRKDGKKIE